MLVDQMAKNWNKAIKAHSYTLSNYHIAVKIKIEGFVYFYQSWYISLAKFVIITVNKGINGCEISGLLLWPQMELATRPYKYNKNNIF